MVGQIRIYNTNRNPCAVRCGLRTAAERGSPIPGGPAGEFDSSRPCTRGAHAFLVPEIVSGPPGPVLIRPEGRSGKDPQSMFET